MVHERWEDIVFTVSGAFALAASLSSMYLIYKHLRNWTQPREQRLIVRLMLMVPIYSTDSWLSLRFRQASVYLDVARDCYEAYALYCFFSLLVAYIESEDEPGSVIRIYSSKEPYRPVFPFCFFPKINPTEKSFIILKRFILQYTIVKPILAMVAMGTEIAGVYGEGQFSPKEGYFYVAIIANVSVFISVYCLILFHVSVHHELKPFSPLPKFLCIKFVLFFAFWQGILISALTYKGIITDVGSWSRTQIAAGLQDFLICIEMYILAIVHIFAFAYQPYRDPEKVPWKENMRQVKPLLKKFGQVVNQKDVVTDFASSFKPAKKKKDPTSDSETSDPKITVEVQTEDTTNKKEETFL